MSDPALDDDLGLALRALSVVRHDVRNLLASVTIIAKRMEESGDDRLAKAAPLLIASMERTVRLGVRAGELATPVEPQPTRVGVAGIVAEDAAVRAEDLDGVEVLADERHLRVMLAELLDNAKHASPGGVTVTAARADGAVDLLVTDEGPGIPDYAQDDLLTPFRGAKRKEGSGLGLPIAARLAQLNGGAVALARTGPDGTVMRLTLPAA